MKRNFSMKKNWIIQMGEEQQKYDEVCRDVCSKSHLSCSLQRICVCMWFAFWLMLRLRFFWPPKKEFYWIFFLFYSTFEYPTIFFVYILSLIRSVISFVSEPSYNTNLNTNLSSHAYLSTCYNSIQPKTTWYWQKRREKYREKE